MTGRMDEWMNGRMDGWTAGRLERSLRPDDHCGLDPQSFPSPELSPTLRAVFATVSFCGMLFIKWYGLDARCYPLLEFRTARPYPVKPHKIPYPIQNMECHPAKHPIPYTPPHTPHPTPSKAPHPLKNLLFPSVDNFFCLLISRGYGRIAWEKIYFGHLFGVACSEKSNIFAGTI
jgi:hypothetical protein